MPDFEDFDNGTMEYGGTIYPLVSTPEYEAFVFYTLRSDILEMGEDAWHFLDKIRPEDSLPHYVLTIRGRPPFGWEPPSQNGGE